MGQRKLHSQTKIVAALPPNAFFFSFFFPVSSSSQCCLSQLTHQILHTNIGRERRQKSVPAILTETVGAQGVQPQENVTTFLNLFWVPITAVGHQRKKIIRLSDRVRRSQLPLVLGNIVVRSRCQDEMFRTFYIYSFNSQRFPKQLKPFHHNVGPIGIQKSILCSGAVRTKTKESEFTPYLFTLDFPCFIPHVSEPRINFNVSKLPIRIPYSYRWYKSWIALSTG